MAEEETDEEVEDAAPAPDPGPSTVGNRTMQVDALVEEVAGDISVPDDALAHVVPDAGVPQLSKPPPLPPKRVGVGTIVAGVVIVILAAGGGIIFGMSFLGDSEPAAEQVAEPAAEAVAEPSAEEGGDVDEEQLAAGDEAEFVPIQLDEVVVPHPDDELLEEEGETIDDEAAE